MIRIFFLLAFSYGSYNICAQASYRVGLLPSINVNKKYHNSWSVNAKIESRQQLKSRVSGDPVSNQYAYLLTDLSLIGSKKVGYNYSFAFGYQSRLEEGALIHRTIQQLIKTNTHVGFTISQRIATDQTFENNQSAQYRLRYRLAISLPTDGLTIDPKEFYIKINNEYLNSWQGEDYDLELRLIPHLGYVFSSNSKLELGLDYRLDSFLKGGSRNSFWTTLNCYVSL